MCLRGISATKTFSLPSVQTKTRCSQLLPYHHCLVLAKAIENYLLIPPSRLECRLHSCSCHYFFLLLFLHTFDVSQKFRLAPMFPEGFCSLFLANLEPRLRRRRQECQRRWVGTQAGVDWLHVGQRMRRQYHRCERRRCRVLCRLSAAKLGKSPRWICKWGRNWNVFMQSIQNKH